MYSSLGYGPHDQLAFLCGWFTVGFGCSLIGAFLVDRVGRRCLLLVGLGGCVVSMAIEAAMVKLYAGSTNVAGLRAGVAALFMFVASYSVSVDIVCYLTASELWPNHLRARGGAWVYCAAALTNLAFTQAAPTAFATIGWKFFLVSPTTPAYHLMLTFARSSSLARLPG